MKRSAFRRIGLAIYVAAVIAAAAAVLVRIVRQPASLPLEPWELGVLVALAAVLEMMVVPLPEGGGLAASFAIYFAALLTLGPATTAWVAALAGLFADAVLVRTKVVRAVFNAAHSVLSLTAAGWVYATLGGEVGEIAIPYDIPAVMGAAITLWALETGWVAVAVSWERGGRVARWVRLSFVPMLALDTALASVGLLLALLYHSRADLAAGGGWKGSGLLAILTILPSSLLYYAYRLQGHVRQTYEHSLRALATLLERKVGDAKAGHGEQVAMLAAAMAKAAQLSAREVEQIRYAALLHDIGKVGVPGRELARQSEQFAISSAPVRLHPEIGEQILAPVGFLAEAARIVRSHHERWDGLGYPDGLRHEEIPLGARLLAVANAYVGMTEVLPPQQALSRLRQAAGSRFDPRCVELLISVLEERGEVEATITQATHLAPARAAR